VAASGERAPARAVDDLDPLLAPAAQADHEPALAGRAHNLEGQLADLRRDADRIEPRTRRKAWLLPGGRLGHRRGGSEHDGDEQVHELRRHRVEILPLRAEDVVEERLQHLLSWDFIVGEATGHSSTEARSCEGDVDDQ